MHRKDIEGIAKAIKKAKNPNRESKYLAQASEDMRRVIALDIANDIKSRLPSFDTVRFILSCGVKVENPQSVILKQVG